MPAIEERDPRFRRLEIKVGLMALIALAGVVFVIILVGIEKDMFTKKVSVRFVAPSGAGFIEGMPVKLSGFKIGRLKKVELTDGANVMVTVLVSKKYQRWVREGSKAKFAKEGFIGDSIIEITPGNPYGREMEDNAEIPYDKTGGMEEIASSARPILEEIKEIIHYVNDPQGDIKATIANIRGFSAGLAQTRGELSDAVREARESIMEVKALTGRITEESGPMLEESRRVVKNIEGLTLRLEPLIDNMEKLSIDAASGVSRLPAIADKIEKTVDNVKSLTDALSTGAPALRDMINDAGGAARDGHAVIKGVRESWPVRLMAPPEKKPELVPLDSYLFEKRIEDDVR